MSGGKGGKVTVGYKYYLTTHLGLVTAVADKIRAIYVDKRLAWSGDNDGSEQIEVDAEDLFGGKEREGGVSGLVSFERGEPSQARNAHLVELLGEDIPAYRGVSAVVLENCYMGNNPYLKPWEFEIERIHLDSQGNAQWYDAKAEIPNLLSSELECLGYECDALETQLALTMDAAWKLGDGGNLEDITGNGYTMQVFSETTAVSVNFIDYCEPETAKLIGQTLAYDNEGSVGLIENFSGAFVMFFSQAGAGSCNLMVLHFNGSTGARLSFDFTGSAVRLQPSANLSTTETDAIFSNALVSGGNFCIIRWQLDAGGVGLAQLWVNGVLHPGLSRLIDYDVGMDTLDFSSPDIYIAKHGGTSQARCTYAGYKSSLTDADVEALNTAYARNFEDYDSPTDCFGCPTMNPAHMIRECLVDPAWGMGYNAADIDTDSGVNDFTQAANTLYDEGLGLSMLFTREEPIENFIHEIERHIDGVTYVDRHTGKFKLKLIRNDQAASDLLHLDETNVVAVEDPSQPLLGDLMASVTVVYTDYRTGDPASVTEHNQALYNIQTGGGNHTTVQYPAINTSILASRLALRDLRALSTPLWSGRVVAFREAEQLNIGDAFVLDRPDLGLDNLICRVQSINFGSLADGRVVIEALEDAFDLPTEGQAQPNTEIDFDDPLEQVPAAAEPRLVIEAPYYVIVIEIGETLTADLLADDPDAGYLLVAAGRQNNEINARMFVDRGAGYEESWILDFCPYATLTTSLGYTDTQFYVTNGKDLDSVVIGTVAQVEDELMRVDAITIDSDGAFVTVGRGVLDTVPMEHELDSAGAAGLGDRIIFWGSEYQPDWTDYTVGESPDVKLTPTRGQNTLAITDAPADSADMNSRAIRPYPPGNLRIDGVSYEIGSSMVEFDHNNTVTWAHRDRITQTDGYLYDYTEGNIGPEAGTTYRVSVSAYDENDALISEFISIDAGSSTTYTFTGVDSNAPEPPAGFAKLILRVFSVRDGYESRFGAEVEVLYNTTSYDDLSSGS